MGLSNRAMELFDWLRGLEPSHDLAALCDVYTCALRLPPTPVLLQNVHMHRCVLAITRGPFCCHPESRCG